MTKKCIGCGSILQDQNKEEDAKKCIEETTNKKIWNSDIEVNYKENSHDKGYSHNNSVKEKPRKHIPIFGSIQTPNY